MDSPPQTAPISALAAVSILFFAPATSSADVYDARTMAMGGTSVASANNDNALFYNSALLAFNDEIEERTQDGRFIFPLLAVEVAESLTDINDISRNNLYRGIESAVGSFNTSPDTLTAAAVVDSTVALDSALAGISNADVYGDVYVGMAVSEPGKWQGAGFFFGVRAIGGGRSQVSEADRATLAAYQEGLTFIATEGAAGAPHPELFDAGGALISPRAADFDSSLRGAGIRIVEVGVAMSKQLQLFGSPIAAGVSFKILGVEAFDDEETLSDNSLSGESNDRSDVSLNLDVGLVKDLGENWRLGFAVKDIIPGNYDTPNGGIVRLRPRPRVGLAYQSNRWQIALDADLVRNETLGGERPAQEAAIGTEWTMSRALKLRAGYRADIQGNRAGIASIGLGTIWRRLAVDVAYAQGDGARSAALQFGIVF